MTAGLRTQSPRPLGLDNSAVLLEEISKTHVSQLACQQESQCFLKLTPQVVNKKRETKSGPIYRSKIGKALTVSFLNNCLSWDLERKVEEKKLNFFSNHWKMPSSLLENSTRWRNTVWLKHYHTVSSPSWCLWEGDLCVQQCREPAQGPKCYEGSTKTLWGWRQQQWPWVQGQQQTHPPVWSPSRGLAPGDQGPYWSCLCLNYWYFIQI